MKIYNNNRQKSNLDSDLLKYLRSSNINSIGGYHIGKTVGKGSFGKVKLGYHKLTGQKVAIKIVDKIHAPIVAREIETWRHLIHPNIIQLYEVLTSETKIYMVIEYAEEGELFDFITKYGRIDEKSVTAKKLFKQLVEAVNYCHQKNFVHRDLKLENVLLSNDFNIKLSDFGFTREFSKSKLLDTYCGSVAYAAPEMISGKQYNGPGADIWSLGVILYTMVCGTLPFDDEVDVVIHQKILNLKYEIPDFVSDDCRDLISRILRVEPSERISIEEILSHPWMQLPPEEKDNQTSSLMSSLTSVNSSYTKLNSQSESNSKSFDMDLNLDSSLKTSTQSLNISKQSLSSNNNTTNKDCCCSVESLHDGLKGSINSINSSNNNLSSNTSINKINNNKKASSYENKRRAKNLYLNFHKDKNNSVVFDEHDRKLLDQLKLLGFNTNAIVESVKNHSCNELSATYYLLKRKQKNEYCNENNEEDEKVFCPSAAPWAVGIKNNKIDFQPMSAPVRSSFTTNMNNRYLWAMGSRKDYINGVMKKGPKLSTINQKQVLNKTYNNRMNSPYSNSPTTYNNLKADKPTSPDDPTSNTPSTISNTPNSNQIREEGEEDNSGLCFKNSSSCSSSNRSLLTSRILQSQKLGNPESPSSTALSPSEHFKNSFIKHESPLSSPVARDTICSNSYNGDITIRNINGSTRTYSPFAGRPKPKKSTLPNSFPNHFMLDEDSNENSSNLISVDEEEEGYEEEEYSSSYSPTLKCQAFAVDEVHRSPLTMNTMIDIGEGEENEDENENNSSERTSNSEVESSRSSQGIMLNNDDFGIQKKPALPTQNELESNNSFDKYVKEKYSSSQYGKNSNNTTSSANNLNDKSVNDFTSSPRFINYTNNQLSNFSQFYSSTQNNDNIIKLDIPDKFIAKSTLSCSSSGISETSGYNNDDYINYFHQPEANQTNNRTSY